MSLTGDGAAGFTELSPGATAWLSQERGNWLQLNNQQPYVSALEAGELIPAGSWVYMGSDGKVYLGDWSDPVKRFVIGFCPLSIAATATGRVFHMGKVLYASGYPAGDRLYLTTGGAVSDTPADGSDLAKKLVMGQQWGSGYLLVNCLHSMNAF